MATASSGATVWAKLTHNNLQTTGNPFGAQLLHVRYAPTSGTAGESLTAATWNTRTLATSVTNEITSASLGSNQITLPTGTYYINATIPASQASGTTCHVKSRLRNITAGTTTLVSVNVLLAGTGSVVSGAITTIKGRFTVSGSTVFEIQTYPSITAFGGTNASSGEVEVYSDVHIWKVS